LEKTLTLTSKLVFYLVLTLIGAIVFFYIWFSVREVHYSVLDAIADIYVKYLIDYLTKRERDDVLRLLIGASASAVKLAEKPEDIYKAIKPLKEYLIQKTRGIT